mmetsp:Transcript_19077/g.51716  ORF Transcript_19077/g.51716 Transcript_19077/m.51716 type:complete len:236 (+) Transcript_19077:459-1166(+)
MCHEFRMLGSDVLPRHAGRQLAVLRGKLSPRGHAGRGGPPFAPANAPALAHLWRPPLRGASPLRQAGALLRPHRDHQHRLRRQSRLRTPSRGSGIRGAAAHLPSERLSGSHRREGLRSRSRAGVHAVAVSGRRGLHEHQLLWAHGLWRRPDAGSVARSYLLQPSRLVLHIRRPRRRHALRGRDEQAAVAEHIPPHSDPVQIICQKRDGHVVHDFVPVELEDPAGDLPARDCRPPA